MKKKNIKFDKITEDEARDFLIHNSYYKKVTSYQNNFHYSQKEGQKKYSDLDFAYLVEISRVDMEFRFLVMRMCLNIEHALKVRAINICLEHNEDGYKIVKEYFASQREDVREKILKNANNSYCTELILKYEKEFPIWALFEVISFGDLCHFYKFLSMKRYVKREEVDIIFHVRNFRNAAAHNHCLLSQLKINEKRKATTVSVISQFIAENEKITKSERKNRLASRCLNDFVTLLYAYEYYVESKGIIKRAKDDIRELFFERMLENKNYFKNSQTIINAYSFAKKVLDRWL